MSPKNSKEEDARAKERARLEAVRKGEILLPFGGNGEGRPARGALDSSGKPKPGLIYGALGRAVKALTEASPSSEGFLPEEYGSFARAEILSVDPTYSERDLSRRARLYLTEISYRTVGGRDESKGDRDGIGFGRDSERGERRLRYYGKGKALPYSREYANRGQGKPASPTALPPIDPALTPKAVRAKAKAKAKAKE